MDPANRTVSCKRSNAHSPSRQAEATLNFNELIVDLGVARATLKRGVECLRGRSTSITTRSSAWAGEHLSWGTGKSGDADVLPRAKGTSVGGLIEPGVAESNEGNRRLLRWARHGAGLVAPKRRLYARVRSAASACAPLVTAMRFCSRRFVADNAEESRTDPCLGIPPQCVVRAQRLGRKPAPTTNWSPREKASRPAPVNLELRAVKPLLDI